MAMTNNPPSSASSKGLKNKIKASLAKPIWFLRRKCACSGKKSVQVKENAKTETKVSLKNQDLLLHSNNNDGFTFPVLKPKSEDREDYSLRVFRPQENHNHNHNGNGNDNGRGPSSSSVSQSPKSGGGGGMMMEDDVASDASSDLFEIHNLSTQPTSDERLTELVVATASAAAISQRRNPNGEAHREMG